MAVAEMMLSRNPKLYPAASSPAFAHGFLPTASSPARLLKLPKVVVAAAASSPPPSSTSSNKKEEEEEEEDRGDREKEKRKKKSSSSSSSSSSLEVGRGGSIKGFGTSLQSAKLSPKDKGKQKSDPKPNPSLNPNTTSRRASPAKPLVAPPLDPEDQQIENVFVLGLSSIGLLIFLEGISLAASGLLPEEWDALITKFVYPSFTPTVGLFLAGAVFYGVYKFLQARDQK